MKKISIETSKEELIIIYNCVCNIKELNDVYQINQVPKSLLKIQNDLNKILNELP